MMIEINGYVKSITYRNEDNGYTVMTVATKEDEITCVGNLAYIGEGECLNIKGEEIQHRVYGRQIRVDSYELVPISDEMSIRRYLGSGAIKGVGAVLASRIVDAFGSDTFRIIEEEPERLSEIRGITDRKAMEIYRSMEEKRETRDVMMYLQTLGISPALSTRIYRRYGDMVQEIISVNPYRMVDEIDGMAFAAADSIARKIGVAVNAGVRVKSGMCYALKLAEYSGHTYLPKKLMIDESLKILGLKELYMSDDTEFNMDMLDTWFSELLMEQRIVVKNIDGDEAVFLYEMYMLEAETASILENLDAVPRSSFTCKDGEQLLDKKISEANESTGTILDEDQKAAVKGVFDHGVSVITGGPGTGKTTIIKTIISMFESGEENIILAAPTGRAAKRMNEATGHEAKTIHRTLEVEGSSEDDTRVRFGKNESEPLLADLIIVDEISMVDIRLMNALVRAIPDGARLVLVGDVNQLASVGAGNVLRDIVDSEKFCVTRLSRIYRQKDGSRIIENAHKINAGKHIVMDNSTPDFLYLKRDNLSSVVNTVLGLITEKLPGYVGADIRDIQVLTPMRKGNAGVEGLNPVLQSYINPGSDLKNEKKYGEKVFREGDKIMQTKNDYHMSWEIRNDNDIVIEQGVGIFNGDMGTIEKINNFTGYMEVKFDDDRYVIYDMKEMDNLDLAYATTIHKSQGSEYPAVIIPLITVNPKLMTRNLLYTAVTRAKKCVCIVGDGEIFDSMIDNVDQRRRYSGLCWQLTGGNDASV